VFLEKNELKIRFLESKNMNIILSPGDLIFRKPRTKIKKWLLRIKLKENPRFKTLIE
jgi:hypothetical protein